MQAQIDRVELGATLASKLRSEQAVKDRLRLRRACLEKISSQADEAWGLAQSKSKLDQEFMATLKAAWDDTSGVAITKVTDLLAGAISFEAAESTVAALFMGGSASIDPQQLLAAARLTPLTQRLGALSQADAARQRRRDVAGFLMHAAWLDHMTQVGLPSWQDVGIEMLEARLISWAINDPRGDGINLVKIAKTMQQASPGHSEFQQFGLVACCLPSLRLLARAKSSWDGK